jgi:hypothetical protein
MKSFLFGAAATVVFLFSCASTHPGNIGKTAQQNQALPLIVSAETIDGNSNDAFQLIELTLENTSSSWVRINRGEVPIQDPSTHVSLVVGKDLRTWAQAMEQRLKKDEYNRELLQTALIVGGSVAAVAGARSDAPGVAAVGAATAVGGYIWAVSDTLKTALRSAEKVDELPENHFKTACSVPGKMFIRRWVLLNKPAGTMIHDFYVEIENTDGEREGYAIKI